MFVLKHCYKANIVVKNEVFHTILTLIIRFEGFIDKV